MKTGNVIRGAVVVSFCSAVSGCGGGGSATPPKGTPASSLAGSGIDATTSIGVPIFVGSSESRTTVTLKPVHEVAPPADFEPAYFPAGKAVPTAEDQTLGVGTSMWALVGLAAAECHVGGASPNALLPDGDAVVPTWAARGQLPRAWSMFSAAPSSCDQNLAMEEAVLCAADKLASVADAIGPVVWTSAGASGRVYGSQDGTTVILPLSAANKAAVRDMALHLLANVAVIDATPVGDSSLSCARRYAALASGGAQSDSVAQVFGLSEGASSIYLPPRTLPFSSDTLPLHANARLIVEADVLRAAGQLTHDLVVSSVNADRELARSNASQSLDSMRSQAIAWGTQHDGEVPYNSLAHATRVIAGRLELGAGTPDRACHGVTSSAILSGGYGADFTARAGQVPLPTLDARQAADLVATSGVVLPAGVLEGADAGTLRAAVLDQLQGQAALAQGKTFADPESRQTGQGKLIDLALAKLSDAALFTGLRRNWTNFRTIAELPDDAKASTANLLPGLLAPTHSSSVDALGGLVLSAGIAAPRTAGASVYLRPGAISQCAEYGGEASVLDPERMYEAAFQSSFSLAQTLYRRLVILRESARGAGLASSTQAGSVAAKGAATLRAWAGSQRVAVSFDGDPSGGSIPSGRVYITGFATEELAGGTTDSIQNSVVLAQGPRWVADCAAGISNGCPSDFEARYVRHLSGVSVMSDTAGAASAATFGTDGVVASGALSMANSPMVTGSPDDPSTSLWVVNRAAANASDRIVASLTPTPGQTFASPASPAQRNQLESTVGSSIAIPYTFTTGGDGPKDGDTGNQCFGVGFGTNYYVPLQNELSSTSDNPIESSWQWYLNAAQAAADRADTLGQQVITAKTQVATNQEAALEQLASLCGDIGTLETGSDPSDPGASSANNYVNGAIVSAAFSMADTALTECIAYKSTDIVFLTTDPMQNKSESEVEAFLSSFLQCADAGKSDTICQRIAASKASGVPTTISHAGLNLGPYQGVNVPASACNAAIDVQLDPSIGGGDPNVPTSTASNQAFLASAASQLSLTETLQGGWSVSAGGVAIMSDDPMSGLWPGCVQGGASPACAPSALSFAKIYTPTAVTLAPCSSDQLSMTDPAGGSFCVQKMPEFGSTRLLEWEVQGSLFRLGLLGGAGVHAGMFNVFVPVSHGTSQSYQSTQTFPPLLSAYADLEPYNTSVQNDGTAAYHVMSPHAYDTNLPQGNTISQQYYTQSDADALGHMYEMPLQLWPYDSAAYGTDGWTTMSIFSLDWNTDHRNWMTLASSAAFQSNRPVEQVDATLDLEGSPNAGFDVSHWLCQGTAGWQEDAQGNAALSNAFGLMGCPGATQVSLDYWFAAIDEVATSMVHPPVATWAVNGNGGTPTTCVDTSAITHGNPCFQSTDSTGQPTPYPTLDTGSGSGFPVCWAVDNNYINDGSVSVIGLTLRPTNFSPGKRVAAFVNRGSPKTTSLSRQVVAQQAVGLACVVGDYGVPEIGDAPPTIASLDDVPRLEAWLRQESRRATTQLGLLYLEGVPTQVSQDFAQGRVGTGSTRGQHGSEILELEQAMQQIVQGWVEVSKDTSLAADAIKAANLQIQGAQLAQQAADIQAQEQLDNIAIQSFALQAQTAQLQASEVASAASGIGSLASGNVGGALLGGISSGAAIAGDQAALSAVSQEQSELNSLKTLVGSAMGVTAQTEANQISTALNNLVQSTQTSYAALETALSSIRSSTAQSLSLTSQLAVTSQTANYQAGIAMADLYDDTFDPGQGEIIVDGADGAKETVQLPVSTILLRQADVDNLRYQSALSDAQTLACLARFSIEERIGVSLTLLPPFSTFGLDSPLAWADSVGTLDGIKYSNAAATTASLAANNGMTEAQLEPLMAREYVGDYVQKLSAVVTEFDAAYPFTSGQGQAVVSLAGNVISGSGPCMRQGANLLYFAGELNQSVTVTDAGGHQVVHGWQSQACDPVAGTCLEVNLVNTTSSLPVTPVNPIPSLAYNQESVLNLSAAPQGSSGAGGTGNGGSGAAGGSDSGGTSDGGTAGTGSVGGAGAGNAGSGGGSSGAPSGPPLGSVWQDVQLDASQSYVISWWDQSRNSDGSQQTDGTQYHVGIYAADWTPVGTEIMTAHPSGNLAEWGTRINGPITGLPSTGAYHIAIGPLVAQMGSTDAGLLFIADMQLEVSHSAQALQAQATQFIPTEASLSTSVGTGCPTTDVDVRSAFHYTCGLAGMPSTQGPDCGYVLDESFYWSYNGQQFRALFPESNINYRFDTFAVNLVGTGVHDCTSTPTTQCYSSSFEKYSLIQDSRAVDLPNAVTDSAQEFNFGTAAINLGNALSAEKLLTSPLSDSDNGLISQPSVQSLNLRGRPLEGTFGLTIYDSPSLNWSALQDIQLVIGYRYWTPSPVIPPSSSGGGQF